MIIDFLELKGICTRQEYEEWLDSIELADELSNKASGVTFSNNQEKIDIKIETSVLVASRKIRKGNHILFINGMLLTLGKDNDYTYKGNEITMNLSALPGDNVIIQWIY